MIHLHVFDYRTPLHCCHPYAAFQAVRLFIALIDWVGFGLENSDLAN